jgi:MYXO-CTERM domain-containing protein
MYEVDTDRDGVVDSMDPCPTDPDPTCTARASREAHGGCAAGGPAPGTGTLAALGFLLLAGIRAGRRRSRCAAPPCAMPR